ncbi:lipid IV(A) 3-deoxy-D-manno-octulosonic acid transferase [Kineobactrum salinum]|uniref:3-deoxy-D-manno-octulosonic acid transferase n=1 Tax=Kineobactrum salinum TaxID=2708301 RepID=A0A6C0TZX9_9GAMM|nr:lipid IV(A) 3-deoxy-D-manno-octulosonic acid transferase [Kineobactrum salinum]QIB65402.1 3-deoxy-D-manno-octulosonic acid transferase [Kineobactrum salinum]
MPRAIYSLLLRLGLPFILLQLWWSGRRDPRLRANWRQRLGLVETFPEPVIWVHAVSVGETIAAAPLVERLLQRYPRTPILMTAMTPTGTARVQALFGDRVSTAFSPYDTPGSVRRFLDRVRPLALIVMETELWPNMVSLTAQRGIPMLLVNARLSERSAGRYQRVSALLVPVLGDISWIAAQANEDAQRFLRIGARPGQVTVTGSVKFDIQVTGELRAAAGALRTRLGAERPVWLAASTHAGEDRQLLAAHRQLLERHPDALLVLVPRHPERFEPVAALADAAGLRCALRSRGAAAESAQVYLGDTMGELMLLYGAADLAFVGGSLITRGGHNPLEPAAWGLPVLAGPHVFNFEVIYEALAAGQGLITIRDSDELARQLLRLFADRAELTRLGLNAQAVVEANRGALDRVVAGIAEQLPADLGGTVTGPG